MDIPHDLSGRVEATCQWLESGTSVFTTDMAHDIRARIAELEHILKQTTGQREYAATQRAEQAEAILLGEDVTVAAYQNMQAALAEAQVRAAGWELSWQKADKAAEQAEAHAADCQRLVTAAEDDIDALRLLNREYRQDRDKAEAEVARLRKLFGMAERGTK